VKASIELGGPGARRAAARGDVVVLIDALRASTTIACGLAVGAERIIPVLSVEEAVALRQELGCLVAGERGGAKIEGFDFGNSPTELLAHRADLEGRPLVLTTSNGTRCVNEALEGGASAILAAAPPNARVAARAAWELADRLGRDVALLAAGLDDGHNDEDWFTAHVLLQILAGDFRVEPVVPVRERAEPAESVRIFADSEAGRRLVRLGYAADVAFCAQFDRLAVAPIYRDGAGFVRLDDGRR
jgi:2-phosphosulfolactate phosphatase